MALVDQGLTSGAGFGMNVLLARWMPADEFGAFAVVFAGFLFASGLHNVLVLEPMSVFGSSRYSNRLSVYFVEQIRAHGFWTVSLEALGLLAGAVMLIGNPGSELGSAMLGMAVSFPFLLLLWLVRRMCYVVQNANLAVKGSLCNLVIVSAGALTLHDLGWINPFAAFVLLGLASLISSLVVVHGLGILRRPFLFGEFRSLVPVLSENWQYGRWLTLTNTLSWASVQSQTIFAAGLLGLSQTGILRAMQLPALGMGQVISATISLALPSLAKELGSGNLERLHRKTVLTAMFLAVAGGLFVASLVLFSGRLEHLLYGGKYGTSAWMIPILGLAPVCTGFCSSFSYALRALGKSQYELIAYVCSAAIAIVSSVTLIPIWGLRGAVASILFGAIGLSASVFLAYRRWGFPLTKPGSLVKTAD